MDDILFFGQTLPSREFLILHSTTPIFLLPVLPCYSYFYHATSTRSSYPDTKLSNSTLLLLLFYTRRSYPDTKISSSTLLFLLLPCYSYSSTLSSNADPKNPNSTLLLLLLPCFSYFSTLTSYVDTKIPNSTLLLLLFYSHYL